LGQLRHSAALPQPRKRIGETGRRETADGETEKIRWGDKLREISDQLSV